MSAEIVIVAQIAAGGAIGRGGDQPFHLREDFRRFKAITLGYPVIMGRKTFEALPGGALPGRRNIVLTRSMDYKAIGAETAPDLNTAIGMCSGAEKIMIIGGAQIYAAALPLAHRMELTYVDAAADGADTFFPAYDSAEWRTAEVSDEITDARSGVRFRYHTLLRR